MLMSTSARGGAIMKLRGEAARRHDGSASARPRGESQTIVPSEKSQGCAVRSTNWRSGVSTYRNESRPNHDDESCRRQQRPRVQEAQLSDRMVEGSVTVRGRPPCSRAARS